MEILRWAVSIILLVASAWLIILNASVLWKGAVLKEKTPSWIPLVGGIFGAIGLLALPVAVANRLWFVPLLVDWGSAPGMLFTLACILRDRWQKS